MSREDRRTARCASQTRQIKNISLAHCTVWAFLKGILERDKKKKKKKKGFKVLVAAGKSTGAERQRQHTGKRLLVSISHRGGAPANALPSFLATGVGRFLY